MRFPSFVQNRCFAHLVWGSRRADFCEQRGIVYQGFSLLTANQEVLHHSPLIAATELNATPAQLVFAFAPCDWYFAADRHFHRRLHEERSGQRGAETSGGAHRSDGIHCPVKVPRKTTVVL